MAETQKDMDETEKDMDETQKDRDEGERDMDEEKKDMDKEQIDMDDAEKDIAERHQDMDEEKKGINEGLKDMHEEQKDMDEGIKDMDEEQIYMDEVEKDMGDTQNKIDEGQKDIGELEKDMGETPNEMDEGQKDLGEQQKSMDDGQTSLSVVSEEDSLSPCLGQQVEEVDGGAHEGLMETQQKLGQGHGTLEQLRQRQQEDQEEMEEVNRRREERNRAREEEEQRRGEEESHKQKQVEEETRTVNEGIDRRRASAERRLKNLSISSNEGDESLGHFSPMSPTFKLNERTESLNRSLQKSNSIKKTEPPLPISKIDNRLEQYTHAIEEAKVAKQQALTDLPSPSEPVASKKSLFEAGEAWSQTPKGTPSKDTEGLKVGVADLIHQWVKGNPDGSCKSPSSIPAEVKAGDVLSKKNLWENVGDSPSPGRVGKGAAGKKYKFVMMAHGKYEKVAVGDDA
uniref:Lymphocyte specific protein 1 a n=1 Tax=Esox lucius TaxID=8010 RepID=A0A3P9ADQ8_ESOLU